jgi:hypothetical protein
VHARAGAPDGPSSPVETTVGFTTPGLRKKVRFASGMGVAEDRAIVPRADDWRTARRQFYPITW